MNGSIRKQDEIMALEASLRDCCAGLLSVRAADRRKKAEELKEFLMRNAVPKLLTENAKRQQGFNWDHVFDAIHEFVLKEVEKDELSKTFDSVIGPLCTNLLHLCLAGAKAGKVYVKCEKVIDACLFILKDLQFSAAIGDAYLKLLSKQILSCDHYLNHITPNGWEELLDVILAACRSKHSKLDSITRMKLLAMLIKNSRNCVQFVVPVRDALAVIKKCFLKVADDKKVLEIVIEIIISLQEMLCVECRLTLCDFVESLLSPVLKFYDQNMDYKKKVPFFKLLHLAVIIHHPEGRKQIEIGSLAANWDVWNRHLNNFLEIICLEVTSLQKLRKQDDNALKLCDQLYQFAAAVYMQTFNLTQQDVDDDEGGHSSKRARVAINKNKCFNDLIDELKQNHIPWLGIISAYVKKFGKNIPVDEYTTLISVMESLAANNVHVDWEMFEETALTALTHIRDKNADTEVPITLWNSCVRTSTVVNAAHSYLHKILQCMINFGIAKYENVAPLLKMYWVKSMPVTTSSLATLNRIIYVFYKKCTSFDERLKYLSWLIEGHVTALDVNAVQELFVRLICTDKHELVRPDDKTLKLLKMAEDINHSRNVMFNTIEECILYNHFEYGEVPVPRSAPKPDSPRAVMDHGMNNAVRKFLKSKLTALTESLKQDGNILESINFLKLILAYHDILLRYELVSADEMQFNEMYCGLKVALRLMYMSLTNALKNVSSPSMQLIKGVQDILLGDYHPLLCTEVRRVIDRCFFQCINNMMNMENKGDEEDIADEDPNALRHDCIFLLAAYCIRCEDYRDEVLDLILDPELYNFTNPWEFECAVKCMKVLYETRVEKPPLKQILGLLQNIVKVSFRDSKITYTVLCILEDIIHMIWSDAEMNKICCLIIKAFMQRCEKLFYPPKVAALIYCCGVRFTRFNSLRSEGRKLDIVNAEMLWNKIKGDVHCLRLHCCQLLKIVVGQMPASDVEAIIPALSQLFVIQVTERVETVLKDELTNRALTVLRCFEAIAMFKKSLHHTVVLEMIQMQKEKSIDLRLTKSVVNMLTTLICSKPCETYLKDEILSVIHFWFSKGHDLQDLPLQLFGFTDMEAFIEKYMKWLIPAEILWKRQGNVNQSVILHHVITKTGKSLDSVIESCICNIIILSLPYVVAEQYNLTYCPSGRVQWAKYAEKLFSTTRENILGIERWSSLFVENLTELVTLIATHLNTYEVAKKRFNVNIPPQRKTYLYPKEIFDGILKYIQELIEEDTMNYLCEHQPLAIFRTLFKLWDLVLKERVFECKVVLLENFMTFVKLIPMGHQSDAFVCNCVCTSISHAIKASDSNDEIRVFTAALKTIFARILIPNATVLRKAVSEVLTILMIKKEEGFVSESADLIKYLVKDMKDYLKDSEDVIDFVASMSQKWTEDVNCTTKAEFSEKLIIFIKSLSCPSHETFLKLRQFLKVNKVYALTLCEEFNNKGFSDDCGTSVIHQIIHALSNALKTASDNKTKIEACNCLAEIGNYDLKTLVTVPPADTKRIISVPPKQYFAIIAMRALADVLFDEKPAVTNAAAQILHRLLQHREGKNALDLEEGNKELLAPFGSTQCAPVATIKIKDFEFQKLRNVEVWLLKHNETHTQWLTRVTVAILSTISAPDHYLIYLSAVCVKPQLCRKILAPLVGILIEHSSEYHVIAIGEVLNQFFKHIWDANNDRSASNSEDSICKRSTTVLDQNYKMVVQYVLEIVDFVRLQKVHYKSRSDRIFESYNYLRLEYNKVAWAATLADLNLAAIYYGELWTIAINGGVPPPTPEATTQLCGGEDVQKIFRKCYVSIGELDAIDSCGTAHLTSEDEKRKHLINIGQFADALLLHDIALSCEGQSDPHLQYGAVKCLHMSGMHHLALQYIKSLPENDALNDIKYECLSFLGDWSEIVDTCDLEVSLNQIDTNILKPNSVIKVLRYACLKDCLNIIKPKSYQTNLLNSARLVVANLCQNLNMENCQNVYKVLTKLHLFQDIEDYLFVRRNEVSVKELVNQWQVDRLPAYNDFKYLEALVSQRSLILEHAAKEFNGSLNDITSLQVQYAELGLSNKRVQMAQRLLAVTKKLQPTQYAALIDSQISWAKGHKDIALSLLRNIVNIPSPDVQVTATSLRQYGLWMAESKRDNPREIIDKYLKKSLQVLSRTDHKETRLKVYYDIAKFADAEYKQVTTYMSSSVFEKKLKVLENMRDAACSLRSQKSQALSKEERRALAANDAFGNIEEAEIASIRAEKESFLHLAMRYYLLSLKLSDDNNLSVFRVISLWLDNPGIELADCEDGSFEDLLHAIPSRKYIAVLPQLVPRLTMEKSPFAENLKKIIKRCATDHPHHTLPILFSLKNSDKDKCILNASQAVGSSHAQAKPSNEPRVLAAQALIDQLARETGLAVIIMQMEKMCDAIISFANYAPKTKDPSQKQPIPNAECIHRLGHLDAIPIPTVTIPVRADCDYSQIATLVAFENYFETVGGINCPKKINCRGSDGISRILLIKGEDDLRQDAVMQQVFNIVNTLLENDNVTSRSKLHIRTYKVVPMSRKSGVLEWCEGTMPIGSYLVGPSGAHGRYRPQDISANVARQKLTRLYETRRPNSEKLTVYQRILKEFRPVFHYFFTEHYLDPVTWYERRLAYTKSVAASSMVGYILGLGDRHLQNILIDKRTAEVVHIDFGIAFDQGKALPTPETIPFRLTPDIVAGFGCGGVEGIFRRSSEKSMQLLRDNQDTLLTILQVLLCDPLYSWTVTSKQQNVSNQASGADGSLAKRALLTVSSKLSGTEGGVAGGVAVPGQVARLIHTAMDPVNLSRLYPGWQPYL